MDGPTIDVPKKEIEEEDQKDILKEKRARNFIRFGKRGQGMRNANNKDYDYYFTKGAQIRNIRKMSDFLRLMRRLLSVG